YGSDPGPKNRGPASLPCTQSAIYWYGSSPGPKKPGPAAL
ncbi:unnamed protein product, partial [Adineta steineri]